MPSDGKGIVQRLGRVFMHPVTCIDYGCAGTLSHKCGSAGHCMADDNYVGVHSVERSNCVTKRFTLTDA
jgi:hypothetical protein